MDVGAHIGGHTVGLAHAVGPSGTVYALEAQSAMFDVLQANAQLVGTHNIVALHTAVGGVCPGPHSTPPLVPVPRVDPRNRSSSVPHWRTITGLDRPGMVEAMGWNYGAVSIVDAQRQLDRLGAGAGTGPGAEDWVEWVPSTCLDAMGWGQLDPHGHRGPCPAVIKLDIEGMEMEVRGCAGSTAASVTSALPWVGVRLARHKAL